MWETTPLTLPQGLQVTHAAAVLVAALGCGLVVGTERERRKGQGTQRALAGLRTFALVSVLGAAGMLTGQPLLVAVGALLVAALGVVAHARDASTDPGVTTEVALLLTYVVGVLCVWSLPLAAGLAVGMTGLLFARQSLHRFARHWLLPGEVRDGIFLAALVLMALPLMPDKPLWGQVLNPHVMVQLLAVLLAIQSLAHLSQRLLAARQAVALSAVASGFVSSTATIASMGLAVREGREGARLMAGAGVLSCVATATQLLMVALAVQPSWWPVLWWPCLVGALVALAYGGWLVRGVPEAGNGSAGVSPRAEGVVSPRRKRANATEARMFSLQGAVWVAALLTAVQVLVYGLQLWLGHAGAMVATMVAALADLHSAVAAVLMMSPVPDQPEYVWTLMLAMSVHAVSKSVTAGLAGGRDYLVWLVPGVLLHTLAMVLGLAWAL